MAELAFARQFLTALDSRPQKLSSDHIADPRSYPSHGPYILPRHPSAPQKKRKRDAADDSATAASAQGGITINLKSMKPSNPSITLSSQPVITTSIFDIKQQYSTQTSIPTSAIKLLYAKKPVGDSKTVEEVIGSEIKDTVEFTVMVMGGALASVSAATPVERTATPPVSAPDEVMPDAPVAQGPSGAEILQTDEFWSDLKGFLLQRVRDEEESERLIKVWRDVHKKAGS